MNIQDKIGREQYEKMKAMFTAMFNGDQAKVDIMMNTKLAHFFKGKIERSYTWTPATGKTAGITRAQKYIYRLKRDNQTAKILLKLELQELKLVQPVPLEQIERAEAMLNSPDEENLVIAEAVINKLRSKRLKKEQQMKNKVGVALVKEACPVCAKALDGPIIMNTRLSEKRAEDVQALHGQIVGFRDEPCDECKELLTKGFVLIGIIEEKTEDMKNPFRSGHMWCITSESANELITDKKLMEKGYACIDVNFAESIGLPIFA